MRVEGSERTPEDGERCDPGLVGNLGVLQSAVGAMPTPSAIASLIEAGLARLPGIGRARLSAFAEPLGPDADAPGEHEAVWLETLHGRYGWLELALDDRAAFAPYEPYVRNLANAIALHLEGEYQRRRLEGLVAELNRANGSLRAANARHLRDVARERFLARASQLLATSRDVNAVLVALPRLVAEHFGGVCVVQKLDEDGRLAATSVEGPNQDRVEGVRRLFERFPDLSRSTEASADLIRRGEPVLIEWLSPGWLRSRFPPDQAAAIEALGIRSYLGVPLRLRGELVGVLDVMGERRDFDAADLRTAQDVAGRIALALENAKLLEETGQAVADRERLLAVVSHDLRNPLTAVRLQLELLERRLREVDGGETLAERLGPMRAALKQMQQLLGDLLDVSRLQAGTLVLAKRRVDVRSLVRDAIEVVRPIAERKGVAVAASPGDEPLEAECDPDRIHQVLANLLGNAVKFTPAGGHVEATATRGDGSVCLAVRDDGPGIAPEALSRIFDRFWQADPGGRAGLGLGLAIVKSIVESHGGRVRAESEVGRGTTMHVTLPAG